MRYIERVLGTPELIEQIVDHMLDDGRAAMVLLMEKGEIRIERTDAVLCVVNGRVATVRTRDMQAGHRPPPNRRK